MRKVTASPFPYVWKLSDPLRVPYHGKRAFGTFICGGGSSMGYKLAGYDHLGGVEFTDHYSDLYRENLNPDLLYVEDIRKFNEREDLPAELYDLDLLDGSPPCAAFSSSGAREKLWGKASSYEGFKVVKDDLLFVYGDTILKLRPKVFLLENVSGLLKGNAKAYLKEIVNQVSGEYSVQVFSLNAASMGVPQMRQRVFVIGLRKDYDLPKLDLDFAIPAITFRTATKKYWEDEGESIEPYAIGKYWEEIDYPRQTLHNRIFNLVRPSLDRPVNTLTETMSNPAAASVVHPIKKRKLNRREASALQSFPTDYNFLSENPLSAIGRSVPPVMMANLSYEIYKQWLLKL